MNRHPWNYFVHKTENVNVCLLEVSFCFENVPSKDKQCGSHVSEQIVCSAALNWSLQCGLRLESKDIDSGHEIFESEQIVLQCGLRLDCVDRR